MLEKEFNYYKQHQDELVEKYKGRWIVIKGKKVVADYDTELEALEKTKKDHEVGTFLIQYVEEGDSSYTQTFHSRVAI